MEVKYLQPQTGEHIFFFCPAGRLIPVEQFLVDWEKHCDELKSVDVVKEYDELEDGSTEDRAMKSPVPGGPDNRNLSQLDTHLPISTVVLSLRQRRCKRDGVPDWSTSRT